MKNLKFLNLIILIALAMIIGLSTSSFAASKTYGIVEYRQTRSDGKQYGYKISNGGQNGKYVWKLVSYNGTAIDYSKVLYCLKAEQGFYTATNSSEMKDTYDQSYDLKNLNGATNPISSYYNQVMWILDHAYIPSASTASTDRATLLANAGITNQAYLREITDDDIDVVQQAAIWYFTNSDNPTYHQDYNGKGALQSILQSAKSGSVKGEYQQIEDTNPYEYKAMENLFKYFVENAKNASSSTQSSSLPLQWDSANPTVTASGDNYILGPYKVNKLSDTPYNVSFTVTDQNGKAVTGYTILNSNKQNAGVSNLADMVGKTFYLSIPKATVTASNITNIKVGMKGTYTTTNATYWTKAGNNSVQPIVEIDRTPKDFNGEKVVQLPQGSKYSLKVLKVDSTNNKALQGAKFKITLPDGTSGVITTGADGIVATGQINVTEAGTDTITVEETEAPSGYQKIINGALTIKVTKALDGTTYKATNATLDNTNVNNGASIAFDGNTGVITLTVKNTPQTGSNYNLKLLKVDSTNNKALQGAKFKITKPDGTTQEAITGADGTISVGPISVTAAGTDTITVEETEAPSGYQKIISGALTVKVTKALVGTTYKATNATLDSANVNNGASIVFDGNTGLITLTVKNIPLSPSNYSLKLLKVDSVNNKELQGAKFKITTPNANGEGTQTKEYVTDNSGSIAIGPIAVTKEGTDSITIEETEAPKGYEKIMPGALTIKVTKALVDGVYKATGATSDTVAGTDVKFDGNTGVINVTITNKPVIFDLALRKFITAVNDTAVTNRVPQVKYSNGKISYEHTKDPVLVKQNDVVTYTLRIFNEGQMAGYANLVKDDVPEGLEFLPDNEINKEYRWKLNQDGKSISTDYLSKEQEKTAGANLIKAFDGNKAISDKDPLNPDYRDVKIAFKVTEPNTSSKILVNIAEIQDDRDENNNPVDDIDSTPNNNNEWGKEDDLDKEFVKLGYFDLALRKFITKVNDTEVTNRIPQVSLGEDKKLHYNHTKDPVMVEQNDVVIYTLRIFNEGTLAGYASKVKDDVPAGLEFLPDNEVNKEYRWQISQDGKSISTDYLSKEQEKTSGANLLNPFDSSKNISDKDPKNPDYRDIKIAFKVTEPNTSDRIIVNTAEIEDDRDENNNPVDDIDSTPNNNNEWGKEDDLDKEFIKVKYFDLALKKWVSKSIVTNQDGSVTETNTGHTGDENPEPPAKVDLGRQDINKVTVKFEFQIKVTNEGEIAGYAKEVTDYIPDGLKFVQADNPNWYERESLNGKPRVATKALENTLLQPGQSATVSIILTWINGQGNMGLKTNIAEISKDYNDSHTPDIDSTPDNFKEGEDDIDTAPVMLTVKLGDGEIAKFIIVGFLSVAMLASGTYVIKRYAL